ncbi:MAG: hypothetical protein KatS3mg115_0973 [Candidatus Poribacteria bacterium]|nr:MAG: hypothetical protein KatS3mg115_0973 [Candidatus Poribacteria bacterium]
MAISQIYLIHHSYTRIGYTDYQEFVFQRHVRNFHAIMEACKKTDGYPGPARFRWTCDTTGPIQFWIAYSDTIGQKAWQRWAQTGRIEACALPFHFIGLPDQEAWVHYLSGGLNRLQVLGHVVRTAMVVGVNGVPYGLVDPLVLAGIENLYVVSDPHRGSVLEPSPGAFWWESLSGNRLLVWNGLPLERARQLGIGEDLETAQEALAELCGQLEESGYPFDFLMLSVPGPGNPVNGGMDPTLSDFVRDWNESASEGRPQLALATPTPVFEELRERYGDQLPVQRGEWPDWWADGVATSAYETARHLRTHAQTRDVEFLGSALTALDEKARYPIEELREAYWHLALFDEHTWGAEASVAAPFSATTRSLWNAKAGFAYRAMHLTDQALGGIVEQLRDRVRIEADGLLVFNPLPWRRDAYLSIAHTGLDTSQGLIDPTEEDPVPKWITDAGVSFVVRNLPAVGYKQLRWGAVRSYPESVLRTEGTALDNRYYRIEVDPDSGWIVRWYDKRLDRELLDNKSSYGLAQYLYERIDGPQGRQALYDPERDVRRTNTPFVRTGPIAARVRSGRQSPLAASLVSEFIAPGVTRLTQEVVLYEHLPWVDLEITVRKPAVYEPEAVYLIFPFFVPNAETRIGTAAGPIRLEEDLLPSTCRDWYLLQGWAAFSCETFTVLVASPDAPLAQFGRINTGRWQTRFRPRSATFISWILNNYWHTNFPAAQEGELRFRYRLMAHEGPFDPVRAFRFGAEAAHPPIASVATARERGLLQELRGEFLRVEPEHVAVLGWKRSEDEKGWVVRLREIAGQGAVARLQLPRIGSAARISPLEEELGPLPVVDGSVIVALRPHELLSVRIHPSERPGPP